MTGGEIERENRMKYLCAILMVAGGGGRWKEGEIYRGGIGYRGVYIYN